MKKFLKKRYLLELAQERVTVRLSYYEINSYNNDFEDYYQWLYLKYRIEYRLKNNYDEFLKWIFYNQYRFKAN